MLRSKWLIHSLINDLVGRNWFPFENVMRTLCKTWRKASFAKLIQNSATYKNKQETELCEKLKKTPTSPRYFAWRLLTVEHREDVSYRNSSYTALVQQEIEVFRERGGSDALEMFPDLENVLCAKISERKRKLAISLPANHRRIPQDVCSPLKRNRFARDQHRTESWPRGLKAEIIGPGCRRCKWENS